MGNVKGIFLIVLFVFSVTLFCSATENMNNFGDTGYFHLPSVEILPDLGFGANASSFVLSSTDFDISVNNVNVAKSFGSRLQTSANFGIISFSSDKNLGYATPPKNLGVNNLSLNIKYLLNKNLKNSPTHVYYGVGCMFNAAPNEEVSQGVRNILNVLFQGMGEPAFVPMPYIVYGSVTPTGSLTLYVKIKSGLGIGGGYRERVFRKFELVVEALSMLYNVDEVKLDKKLYTFGVCYPLGEHAKISAAFNYMKISFEGSFEQFESRFMYPSINVGLTF